MIKKRSIIIGLFFLVLVSCVISVSRINIVQDTAKKIKVSLLYLYYRKSLFPSVSDLSVNELLDLKKEKALVIVDVREPEEQAVSFIPGAITKGDFERNVGIHAGSIVVTYCTIGGRSGVYVGELQRRKIKAFNLKGGILLWVHEKQVVHDGDGPTYRLHVYGKQWNLAPHLYETVW